MRSISWKTKNWSAFGSCFAAVLGLTLASPELSAGELLPFHAVDRRQANPSFTGECTLVNNETGSGVALHLGEYTFADTETVQILNCPPPPTGTALIAVSGESRMVAANGDELHTTYQTTGTLDPVAGVHVQGTFTFVSGTGRFQNVSGGGVIAANGLSTPPFDFVGSLDGTISLGHQ